MSLWGDIATGLASTAGFALGGPVGAALAGAVVGGLIAGAENGWDMDAVLKGATTGAIGGALTMIGGGVGVAAARGAIGAKASLALASPAQLMEQGLFKGFIPRAIGGAHVAPGKLYATMATPLVTPLMNAGMSLLVPPGQGAIPLIDISLPTFPQAMPRVMMPDPAKLPDGLSLSGTVADHYRNLPHLYLANWESFGTEPKEPPPKTWAVPPITAEAEANMPRYAQRVEQLAATYERMRAFDNEVAAAVGRVGEQAAAGQQMVGSQVEVLTAMAQVHPADTATIDSLVQEKVLRPVPPPPGGPVISEDNYVMTVIESVTHRAETDMREMTEAFRKLAGEVEPPATPADTGADPKTDTENRSTTDDSTAPTGRTDETGGPTTTNTGTTTGAPPVTTVPPLDLQTSPPLLQDTADPRSPGAVAAPQGTTAPAATAGTKAAAAAPGSASAPAATVPVAQQQPAATSTMGSGGLDPMLQQAMLQRAAAEQGRGSNRGDRERERRGSGPAPAKATAAGPATQTAAAPRPGTVQPASTGTTAQPANAARTVSAPASTAPPAAGPPAGSNGLQEFVFRDGRTVMVPEVVAHALSAAVSDHVGTDARAAYQRTALPLPPPGQPAGLPVDPSDLRTGDIAQWLPPDDGAATAVASAAASTAIVVMFDNAPPEVIVAGEPRPLTEVLERDGGAFGVFGGFRRPPGADAGATAAPVDPQAAVPVTISG
ncbi:hypothetical protein AB0H71_27090 [Nocardia sp. NPDC050697]|uniref:hypothetical protein n=1 Tax=Nocardia sp. NPDC050697 TaxID=3155158 RepID=UPI003408B3A2